MKKPISILALSILVIFAGCKKDEETPTTPTTTQNTTKSNTYAGSASHGDLMTFEINQEQKTYTLVNETTTKTETGTYQEEESGQVKGLYKASANGESFFAVELDDKIIASNFPSGNAQNEISFGVSSEISNVGKEAELAGDYVYIRMGNVPINGSTKYKEWGLLTVTATGEMHLMEAASGGSGDYDVYAPEDIAGLGSPFPITASSADLSGTWSFDGSNNGRVKVSATGGGSIAGYAYVAGNESVFLMDLGTGEGFALAYKITSRSIGAIAGSYKFIGVQDGGYQLAGVYDIDGGGNLQYYVEDKTGNSDSGAFGPLTQLGVLTNTYYYHDAAEQESYYLIIVGDAIMHFIFKDNGEYVSYGAGAKI